MNEVLIEVRMRYSRKVIKLFKNGICQCWKADDFMLVAEREASLRIMIECFDLVCGRRGLKMNLGKSKVMVLSKGGTKCNAMIWKAHSKQVQSFKYHILGVW